MKQGKIKIKIVKKNKRKERRIDKNKMGGRKKKKIQRGE